MAKISQSRYPFVDHLRGFAFLLMAIDHSLHAYAYHWGRFWFYQDTDRRVFFDVCYMFNNSVIIPLLFFAVGMAVIPGYKKYGIKGYFVNRFWRYVVPFVVCIPTTVAVLTYPKYVTNVAPGIGFFDYWGRVFFTEKLQGGPLWVCLALMVYTSLTLFFYLCAPRVYDLFKAGVKWMIEKPIAGFLTFGLLSAVILGVTDILWGAPWWIGFGKVFYVQGSRFLQQALFFFCGTAIGALGYLETPDLWRRFSATWPLWVGLTVVLGGAYIWYALTYFHDGAYNLDILRHFYRGGNWFNVWPIFAEAAPSRLIRTSLHGFFCLAQVLMFTALIHRFFSKPTVFWTNLAANGYGLFLIHEMIVVWLQFGLDGSLLPPGFKFLIVVALGIGPAWFLSHFLRKYPPFNRVFGPYPFSQ